MLSFRKKILVSASILLLVFIAFLFPFVKKTIENIARKSLEERAVELISKIQKASNEKELLQNLKEHQILFFFRVTLIDDVGNVLYDSHVQQILKKGEIPDYVSLHPEVKQALRDGVGYREGYSHLFLQTFAYVAKAFEFEGKKYVLRTSFPFREIEKLTHNFEIGFLTLGGIVLLLYSLMTWMIIHRLSSPIQQIIHAIKPYQQGLNEFVPQIKLSSSIASEDDFGKLAHTLNSMSAKIQKQIETLTIQTKETTSILDSLVEGVVGINENMQVNYANSRACKMLGISKSALLDANFEEIEKPESILIERCKKLILDCRKEAEVLHDSLVLGDSSKVYINIIAVPRPVDGGAILVLQDKTSDYKILKVGKDFIANASHELRTPITIIRGFAETLQDLPNITDEMLKEITTKIIKTSERLTSLVKNLLTLADVENLDSSNFIETDLLDLLDNAKRMLLAVHPHVKIVIEEKIENIHVFVDPGLLDLAFMNLLENAVKYSEEIPELFITLNQKNDEVIVSIEDHGIGIPSQDLEHIFERFYTVDKARSRRRGGAGLGLSLVKTVIEKHGGEITILSQIGVGTKFNIILPSYRKNKAMIPASV